ncbi:MAG: hypothetical protein C4K58_05460 [Flavobacteriaceae bacterium]|nr:MAG: hypothetical protein C4K58_05460 [Flavobacteriaceae bacterium]
MPYFIIVMPRFNSIVCSLLFCLAVFSSCKSTHKSGNIRVEKPQWIPTSYQIENQRVELIFGNTKDGVNSRQMVQPDLIKALEIVLVKTNAKLPAKDKIKSLYISSTTNGVHADKSNHYIGTAIDISRINGVKLEVLGANNQVTMLQNAMEDLKNVRENYGPALKIKTLKNGTKKAVSVSGHQDHIHFAVQSPLNGDL